VDGIILFWKNLSQKCFKIMQD